MFRLLTRWGFFLKFRFSDLLRIIEILKDVGFHMSFPCYSSWRLMEIIFLITAGRVFGSNELGDLQLVGTDYTRAKQTDEVNLLCGFLSFSCLPESQDSKVFYAKNSGYFIRIIFILYVFYWFFVVFFNFFTMYWWLINFLRIFMPPCLPN